MIIPEWSYLSNPFDNVTKENHKLMYLLATDHFDKLGEAAKTEPKMQELYDLGIREYKDFATQYRSGANVSGDYRLMTARIEQFTKELTSKLIRRWDSRIIFDFDVDTPEYQSLMQGGRAAFQQGAYDVRIARVIALGEQLKKFPNLSELQVEVEEFGKKYQETRKAQQEMEHQDQNHVDLLEQKRRRLATKMHGIFGGLMLHFHEEMHKVENFYELKYLRRSSSKTVEDTVKESLNLELAGGETKVAFESVLEKGAIVRVTNQGATLLQAYLNDDTDEAITVESGLTVTLTATADDSSVRVENLNKDEGGKALVELL